MAREGLLKEKQRKLIDTFIVSVENIIDRLDKLEEPRDAELGLLVPQQTFAQAVKDCKKKLSHASLQFNSDIVVVVSMGILKAGKSTLTNLMARHPEASPTGFGVDTTLRPAIIRSMREDEMRDDEWRNGRIVVYYKSGNDECEDLGRVMNELRGIERSHLNPVRYPLNNRNLTKVLCEERSDLLTGEPLLVVVETPFRKDARMLQDGRMLLDTQGLDSARADEWLQKVENYKSIIKECDIVLFVQNSVAPLNEKAGDCLKKIFEVRDTATAWLVQNRMLIKPWLKSEVVDKELQKQEEKARHTLWANIPDNKGKDKFRTIVTNLGMAYDHVFMREENFHPIDGLPDKSALKEASRYWVFEEELLSELKHNGRRDRFRNCLERFLSEIRDFISRIDGRLSETASIEDESRKNQSRWEYFRRAVEGQLSLCPSDVDTWANNPATLKTVDCKSVFRRVEQSAEFIGVFNESKLLGSDLDRYMEACREQVEKDVNQFFQSDLKMQDVMLNGHSLAEKCNAAIRIILDRAELRNDMSVLPDTLRIKLRTKMDYSYPDNASVSISPQVKILREYSSLERYKRHWYTAGFAREVRYDRSLVEWKPSLDMLEKTAGKAIQDTLSQNISDLSRKLVRQGVEKGSKGYLAEIDAQINKWKELVDKSLRTKEYLEGLKKSLEEWWQRFSHFDFTE